MKKKLSGLTREHEALFNFVEENKHMCTEKEKQKAEYPPTDRLVLRPCSTGAEELNVSGSPSLQMLNRLTKSAEVQTAVDDDYFRVNMEGHQMRLKLENTLKNCHQVGAPLLPSPRVYDP